MENTNSLAAIANLELDISERSLYLPDTSDDESEPVTSGLVASSASSPRDNIDDVAQTAAAARAFPAPSVRGHGGGGNKNNNNHYTSESESEAESSAPRPNIGNLRGAPRSSVSFGSTRNALTRSIQPGSISRANNNNVAAVATAVSAMDEAGQMPSSDYAARGSSHMMHQDSMNNMNNNNMAAPPKSSKKKGVLKKSSHKAPPINADGNASPPNGKKVNRLTKISAMYDMDGDGELNSIEQAMRDYDRDGDGQLNNEEVHRIVQEQLKANRDYGMYKKVTAGLLCLVCILALSNFGTSWASAILSKEVTADSDTGTIQSKTTGEVMAFQQVAHTILLEQLGEEEFEERRRLVDAEMAEDPDHEDHQHRKLGKKKKNKCVCSKVSYDDGRIDERELEKLTKRCDGTQTVNIKRKWKNRSGGYDEDVDQICGPGTKVKRKGKKKRNKKKTKVKVVDEQVTFETGKKGKRDGENESITFGCKNGSCFPSGQTLLQKAGDPCNPSRDKSGASQCREGLVCYDPEGDGDTGYCAQLSRYARQGQLCDIDYEVDACQSGLACMCDRGDCSNKKDYERTGVWDGNEYMQVRTGYCTKVTARSGRGEVCDVSYKGQACNSGLMCLSVNGHEVWGDSGLGYCTKVPQNQRSNGVCDLSQRRNACESEFYCQDELQANFRNGRNGGNGNNGNNGGNNYQGAQITGPSGQINTYQNGGWGRRTLQNSNYQQVGVYGPSGSIVTGSGNAYPNGIPRARTSGTGACTRQTSAGGTCGTDEQCGAGYYCNGQGAETATGGVIRGSSGTIVWGDGGSQTGFCGSL